MVRPFLLLLLLIPAACARGEDDRARDQRAPAQPAAADYRPPQPDQRTRAEGVFTGEIDCKKVVRSVGCGPRNVPLPQRLAVEPR